MNILAIDPGTHCGFANSYAKESSGVWELLPKRIEGPGIRYLRFKKYLIQMLAYGAELVIFEEVRKHMGTAAAHVYGGIVAVLMSTCEDMGIPYSSCPVGVWKKAVVGKGNAKKATIRSYVQAHFKSDCISFDEADAICILEWAKREFSGESEIFS